MKNDSANIFFLKSHSHALASYQHDCFPRWVNVKNYEGDVFIFFPWTRSLMKVRYRFMLNVFHGGLGIIDETGVPKVMLGAPNVFL